MKGRKVDDNTTEQRNAKRSSSSTPSTPYRLALSVAATRQWFKAGAALDVPSVSTKTHQRLSFEESICYVSNYNLC